MYPVNPAYDTLGGVPCFPNVAAIPDPPDLAIVTVPAAKVEDVVREAAEAGVGAIVIYSSGFAELGADGAAAQARLKAIAEQHGVVLCGPNCQGLADFHTGAVSSFNIGMSIENPKVGGLALVGQSGGMGGLIYTLLQGMGVGVGYLVATGNEAALTASDIAEHLLAHDEKTEAVAMFVEGLGEDASSGGSFVRAAQAAASSGKPLVVMKLGRNPSGQRAAKSHTAALAVDDAVFDAVCRHYGVLRVHDVQELVDVAFALGAHTPLPAGSGTAVVSNSGGFAVLMADLAQERGLTMTELAAATKAALDPLLPAFVSRQNPVDTAQVSTQKVGSYRALIDAVAADPGVHQVQMCLAMQLTHLDPVLDAIVGAQAASGKPFVVTWSSPDSAVVDRLRAAGIPAFDDPVRSFRLGAALVNLASLKRLAQIRPAPAEGRAARRPAGSAPMWSAPWSAAHTAFFAEHGVSAAPTEPVESLAAAQDVAARVGYPVALKLWSPKRTHKSDFGGVELGLADAHQLAQAYARLDAQRSHLEERLLVQRMASRGVEIFVGLKRDPHFGPIMLVGSGGIHVEEWADIQVLPLPLDEREVDGALRRLASAPLLFGKRGRPADVAALRRAIAGLADMFEDLPPNLSVFEVNPLIVNDLGSGAWIVDWRCEITPAS